MRANLDKKGKTFKVVNDCRCRANVKYETGILEMQI